MFKKTVLKNGLRIITVPLKNAQSVTVLVLAGAGSKYETKKNNGISHFLEHMIFKGTEKRPTTLKISETLDKVGGIYNAFTSEEYTGYWAKVGSTQLDLALDWISDIFLNSKFEAKEIKKEKRVIVEEINMCLDDPQHYVQHLWTELLYGDQPAGWKLFGEKEVITKFKRNDFVDYFNSQYVAGNTVICVAGNLKTEDVEKKIKKYFESIETGASKPKLKVIEEQTEPRSLVYFKKTDQTHILLGSRGYNIFHPQKYAQTLLSVILGGSMSSRLFISVREKQGLAYYIHTFSDTQTDTGCVVTQAGICNDKVGQAIKAILKEYKTISNKKVSKEDLKKAKDYLKGKMSLLLEPSDAQASFYAEQELFTEKIMTLKEKFAKIDKVTVDDIQEAAQNIFRPEKLNLALVGPFKNKKQFNKYLEL